MGVRGLTTALRPYGSRSQLQGRVVIDGPALAYHMLHIARAEADTLSALDEPSYAVLGSAAVDWLDDLQDRGVVVAAIYFDGRLPAFKKEERLERVCHNSNVSSNYFSATISGISVGAPRVASKARNASQSSVPSSTRRNNQLPVPAFLLPAILEALRALEKYSSITHLVPGEADPFCAADVRLRGGMLLTSDSDLLLYDIGSKGSVIFLNDIEINTATGHDDSRLGSISALTYTQSAVCGKLLLEYSEDSILSLAFEIKMDPHRTLASWVSRSKKRHSANAFAAEYRVFVSQYLENPHVSTKSPDYMAFLDPRISELVLTWADNDIATAGDVQTNVESPTTAAIYLPLLLDRWDQASAWNPSILIRQLAYTLCRDSKDPRSAVVEFRRTMSKNSKGQPVELLDDSEAAGVTRDLVTYVASFVDGPKTTVLGWTTFCLSVEISHAAEQGKDSTTLKLWRKAAKLNGWLDPGSWDTLHLTAQIQGTMYSLRILQQVLGCRLGYLTTSSDLKGQLAELVKYLSSLPSISEMPCALDMTNMFERLQQAGRLDTLAGMAGLPGQIVFEEAGKKSKNRKKTGKLEQRLAKTPVSSSNPFEALDAGDDA